MTFWVTMTDKVLSGWGLAEGKTNKVVFECDTYDEAEIVAENAKGRGDMLYINICARCPRYDGKRYYLSWKNKDGCINWYTKGKW
jgi:hypothetical protein